MLKKFLAVAAVFASGVLLATAATNGTPQDDSEVSVTIISACTVNIADFEAPNGGYLGRNGTGSFESRIVNNGSYPQTSLNASMEISFERNVTNQTLANPDRLNLTNLSRRYQLSNSTENYISNLSSSNESITSFNFSKFSNSSKDFINELTLPRKINLSLQQNISQGYQVKRDYDNFTRNVSTSPANRSVNYVKFFDAIDEYPYHEYNATLNVDYLCKAFNTSEGNQSRVIDKNENGVDFTFVKETIDFSIIRASGGVSSGGNQTTNETIPQDVNRTGESSNQSLEGDNDNPGRTPEPEPEPEPEPQPQPEPDPEARPNLELEPVNRTYTARRQQPKEISITARNMGRSPLSDITIIPQTQVLDGDWQGNDASITSLEADNSLNRSVVITPPATADPGLYTVPVVARNNQSRLDTDYFYVDVRRTSFEPRFSILESPRSLQLTKGSSQQLPILVENTGEEPLSNISAEIQNIGECATVNSQTVETLEPNETTSVNVEISALNNSQTCNSTLLINSQEGAFAYSNLGVTVSPPQGLIPNRQEPPLLAIAWTVLLVVYALIRKRIGSDSLGVNAPLILLIIGEAAIMLYLMVGHYGLVSVPFLPF